MHMNIPAQVAQSAVMEFAMAHPAEVEWLMDNQHNDFAQSLARFLNDRGTLTENQLAAIQRKLTSAPATAISVAAIEAKFAKAFANMIKRPRLNLDTFTFKAVVSGANAGGIYVTEGRGEDGVYLGKVMGGQFMASRDCTEDQKTRIVAAAANPDAAAKAYGQRTGNCAICNRELTAEESIERFIGPICAGKYGM